MYEPPDTAASRQPPAPTPHPLPVQRFGAEMNQWLRLLQAAPTVEQEGLCLRLRDRLEAGRAVLLGPYTRLPAPLRHYAVSLTEVQWLLDAWIAGARTEDGAQLRHDFFQAAWVLFETRKACPEQGPNPRPAGLERWRARLLSWWHALRSGKGGLLGRVGQAERAG